MFEGVIGLAGKNFVERRTVAVVQAIVIPDGDVQGASSRLKICADGEELILAAILGKIAIDHAESRPMARAWRPTTFSSQGWQRSSRQ